MAYAEIKGSNEEALNGAVRTAAILQVSDNGYGEYSTGDYYPAAREAEIVYNAYRRRVVQIRKLPEVIPGIWLITYQFTAFTAE